jgi:hypothetical protein
METEARAKETSYSVKRDLLQCQKRPSTERHRMETEARKIRTADRKDKDSR